MPRDPFYIIDEKLNYIDVFDSHIYEVGDILYPKYCIDFGRDQLPRKYSSDVHEYMNNKYNYAFLTSNFLENEKYLLFCYKSYGSYVRCIYIKKSGEVYSLKNTNKNNNKIPPIISTPIYAKDNYFVSVYSNSICQAIKEKSEANLDTMLVKAVEKIDINSNPLIVQYFMK